MPTSAPLATVATADCALVPGRAFELLDGELDGGDRPALEAHLAVCRRCRVRVEHDRRFLTTLRARDLVEPAPESLRRRVSALLREAGRC